MRYWLGHNVPVILVVWHVLQHLANFACHAHGDRQAAVKLSVVPVKLGQCEKVLGCLPGTPVSLHQLELQWPGHISERQATGCWLVLHAWPMSARHFLDLHCVRAGPVDLLHPHSSGRAPSRSESASHPARPLGPEPTSNTPRPLPDGRRGCDSAAIQFLHVMDNARRTRSWAYAIDPCTAHGTALTRTKAATQ
jgi:hypothetical protein